MIISYSMKGCDLMEIILEYQMADWSLPGLYLYQLGHSSYRTQSLASHLEQLLRIFRTGYHLFSEGEVTQLHVFFF